MELLHPIKVSASKTISQLTFPAQPVAAHFLGTSVAEVLKMQTDAVLQVVSNMVCEPVAHLHGLHFADLVRVQEELLSFLGFESPIQNGEAESSPESSEAS